MDMLGELKFHLWEYADNVIQQDEEVAYRELLWYKEAGGGTICDNSSYGLRGKPSCLRALSERTGVHIVLGTGGYLSRTLPPEIGAMDKYEMAELLIRNIREGLDGSDLQCGFLGEIGVESRLPASSYRSIAAAALAQRETGAAILIHQPGTERQADGIFKIITDHGGDLTRTVMCHCDPLLPDHEYIDHIAKSGAYISFDFFGLEAMLGKRFWLPTDHERIVAIEKQIARGNLSRLVISHDTAYKSMLRQFGGFGYGHIPRNIIPIMLANGYEREWIEEITAKNPREIFSLDSERVARSH